MNDLIARMKATLGMQVISCGDNFERNIAESQFQEAVNRITELEQLTERQVSRTGELTGSVDKYLKLIAELEQKLSKCDLDEVHMETIARTIKGWIDWAEYELLPHEKGLFKDDYLVRSFPAAPSVRVLRQWIKALGCEELLDNPNIWEP